MPAGGEQFRAFPGSPHIVLRADVAATLVLELEPGRPIAHGSDKRRFAIDGVRLRPANAPAPVAGVFVLTRAGAKEMALTRLGFGAGLGEIARHGFHLADDPALIPGQVFRHASALAAVTPAWNLLVPDSLGEVAAATELLMEVDEGR